MKQNKVDFGELIANGAQIIDVRTPQEYKGRQIKKSVNVPLDKLNGQFKKISKNKPVITCCTSGVRSASVKSILQKAGYDAHNGGPWTNLKNTNKSFKAKAPIPDQVQNEVCNNASIIKKMLIGINKSLNR